uniref:Putative secreted protein n=1 Tax=Ixodes ricinus TaxID=34613 RepID=A0A6B0UX83_IXORI
MGLEMSTCSAHSKRTLGSLVTWLMSSTAVTGSSGSCFINSTSSSSPTLACLFSLFRVLSSISCGSPADKTSARLSTCRTENSSSGAADSALKVMPSSKPGGTVNKSFTKSTADSPSSGHSSSINTSLYPSRVPVARFLRTRSSEGAAETSQDNSDFTSGGAEKCL